MYKKEWLAEDRKRVLDLERWYVLDGRHLKEHKLHGVYTGLSVIGPYLDKDMERAKEE